MFAKLDNPRFMADIRPLLAVRFAMEFTDQVILTHFVDVLRRLIALIPGEPWAATKEQLDRHGIARGT